MASIIFTLLISFHLMANESMRLVFKLETPEFTHQLTVEEISSQALRITLNSNTFFSNSSLVRVGIWTVNSPRILDFINSIKATNSQKPEITIDRRGHETQYWISGKKLHLDADEVQAYSELIKSFLMSDSANLEEGFEFDAHSKKITQSKKVTQPKFTCDNTAKQCRFGNTARIAF